MLHRFHDRFGTAGVVIAVIALIAALGGTALAAAGLTSTQKKEVTKIAKKYAGKPGATGPAGTNGTNGANGKDGTNGSQGIQGIQGIPGVDGKTVLNGTTVPAAGLGNNGDFYIRTTTSDIYGPKAAGAWGSPTSLKGTQGNPGSPWTAGGTLPANSTETGSWAISTTLAGGPEPGPGVHASFVPLSFPIPLSAAQAATVSGNVVYVPIPDGPPVTNNPDPTHCPGSADDPQAASGYLCVYEGNNINVTFASATSPGQAAIAAPEGTVLVFTFSAEPAIAAGSFAVTG